MPHKFTTSNKPFDFGADPDHDPDPGILTELLPPWRRFFRLLLTICIVGRARAANAQYVVLGEREQGAIVKDQANKLRERMTSDALQFIDTMDPAEVRRKIAHLQWKAKSERDIENKGKEYMAAVRQSRTHEGEYQLR